MAEKYETVLQININRENRSVRIILIELHLKPETAFEIVAEFGEMGLAQFTDMTPDLKPLQRNYISEVCRCAEMERKLRFMELEMQRDKIDVIMHDSLAPRALPANELAKLETIMENWESVTIEMSENQTTLLKNYLELTEMNYVLGNIGPMLGENSEESIFGRTAGGDIDFQGRLFVISGVVNRKRAFPFEMMMWRVSLGNIYYRLAAQDAILQDPQTGQEIRKVAFIAICQGEQLCSRLEKVCSGFHVNLYPCPQSHKDRIDMMLQLATRIEDLKQVMIKTKYYRCKTLRTVSKQWDTWMVHIKKSKAVYHTMNMFSLDITKKCLIGQCWISDRDVQKVENMLSRVSAKEKSSVESFMLKSEKAEQPPTFHRTNKFTEGFQALINAYGDSTYGELNPGLYTIITFPFLFALMFGDACHGLILLCFALWMLSIEKKNMEKTSNNEIWNIFFGGRYVLLLMGLFTLYTGFLYNCFFSKSIIIDTPFWENSYGSFPDDFEPSYLILDPRQMTNTPYRFGVDPVWALAKNKIMFLNSLKMKMSIIIGVIHMIFGLSLTFFNHMHFKRRCAIFLEFIPQMMFLSCLFLWLVIMIFMKWYIYSGRYDDEDKDNKERGSCAPLIIIFFIDMILLSTTTAVDKDCDAYMFASQEKIQRLLVEIAVICIPILLFGPLVQLYLKNTFFNGKKNAVKIKKIKKEKKLKKEIQFQNYRKDSDNRQSEAFPQTTNVNDQQKIENSPNYSELMIHRALHTIEFCLSTISHTASYLRLWALSLAHEQLSEMLWMMVLAKLGLHDRSSYGGPKIFIAFSLWAVFSLFILVVMEGLSAFLHTLRLHWVEFMSKFYSGTGYPFKPFSFKDIFSGEGRDDKSEAIFAKKTTAT